MMKTKLWMALVLSLVGVACGGGGGSSDGSPQIAPVSDYSLSVEPATLTVGQGREARLSISIRRSAGFEEAVVVTLHPTPAGVTAGTLELGVGFDRGLLPLRLAPDVPVGTVLSLDVQAAGGAHIRTAKSELTVSAPQPYAQELIAAALRDGRIDYAESLLYRAYALFGDARLPADFVGAGSVMEDNLVFEEIRLRLAEFSTERQEELRAYIVRPTDSSSVWNRVAASSTSAARSTALTAGGSETAPEGTEPPPESCAALADWAWISKRSDRFPVRAWMQCGPRAQLPDEAVQAYLHVVLFVLETVYGPMTALMGEPITDTGAGGDEAIDFYIVGNDSSVERRGESYLPKGLGVAYNAPPYLMQGASAFVLIPRSTLLAPAFHTTVIHELFHVLQNKHNARLKTPHDCGVAKDEQPAQENKTCRWHWFVEASAAWAAAHFDRTAWQGRREAYNGTYDFFPTIFLANPDVALNATDDGSRNHDYAAFIWPYFVEQETGGAGFMGQIWRGLANVAVPSGSVDAFAAADDVIDAAYPFASNFSRFALRNLNREFTPDGPLKKSERHVALDPVQFSPADGVSPAELPAELVTGSAYDQPLELVNLSARYVRVTLKDVANVKKVELDTGGLSPSDNLVVEAIILTEAGWLAKPVQIWKGKTEFCFDVGPSTESVRGSFKEMVLVLSNHGLRPEHVIKGELKALATATPCDTLWSGSIRQVVRSVTAVVTTTVTISAHVVFAFDDLAEPVQDEIPFRLRSGTWTYELRSDTTGRNPACRAIGHGVGPLPLEPLDPQVPRGTFASLVVRPEERSAFGHGLSIVTVRHVDDCNDANEDRTTDTVYWLPWWNQFPVSVSADGKRIEGSSTGDNGVEYEISLVKTGR